MDRFEMIFSIFIIATELNMFLVPIIVTDRSSSGAFSSVWTYFCKYVKWFLNKKTKQYLKQNPTEMYNWNIS